MSMKRYINLSVIYAVLAMMGGIFFREFTKFNQYTEKTMLSIVHTHYFVRGMIFFLILGLFENTLTFTDEDVRKLIIAYQIGLNLTILMFIIRGILQVKETTVLPYIDYAISGFSGVGHFILGVAMFFLLIKIKKSCR